MYGFPSEDAMKHYRELAEPGAVKAKKDEEQERALAYIGILQGLHLEKLISLYDED